MLLDVIWTFLLPIDEKTYLCNLWLGNQLDNTLKLVIKSMHKK